MRIAILGGGLAGLEAGKALKYLGKDFVIFEKEGQIGGLARTLKTNGHHWDLGVHALYSKDRILSDYYQNLPIRMQNHSRNVKVYHNGKWISYPFENGIRELPIRDKIECLAGYLFSRKKKEYYSLEDWIENRLGRGISKHFMTPYNKKIWNCPLSNISMDLVNNKIDPMSPMKFLASSFGLKTIGREYQSKFAYPKHGIQEFIDFTAKTIKDKILINKEISEIKFQNGYWVVNHIHFDKVISTIPVPELLKKIEGVDGIKSSYDALRWNDTRFIMIGLKKGCDFGEGKDLHWAFFAGEEPFYRITFMNNFSKEFLPCLVAEITLKPPIHTICYAQQMVINSLLKIGILKDKNDIQTTMENKIKYTYPIPSLESKMLMENLREILRKRDLHLLGRSGGWKYLNMDGVIKEAREYVYKSFGSNRGD